MYQVVVLSFRGTLRETGSQKSHEVQQRREVLHLGKSNAVQQYMLRPNQLESSCAVEDFGVLVDKKIARKSRDMTLPHNSALVKHIWSVCPILGFSGKELLGHTGVSSVKGHQDQETQESVV